MRLSWPELTQNAVSYVLGLRTPLLRQGEVTGFFFRTFLVLFVKASVFCLRRVFIAYYRVSCYIFFSVSAVSILSLARVCYDSGECTTAFVMWFAL